MQFFQKIHPSYFIITFCIGVVIGAILCFVTKTIILSSPLWAILSVILMLIAVIIARPPLLFFSVIAGILIVITRASPTSISQEYFQHIIGQNILISGCISKDPTESSSGKYNVTLDNLKTDRALSGQLFVQLKSLDISDSAHLERSDCLVVQGEVTEGFGVYQASILRPEIQSVDRYSQSNIFLIFRNQFAKRVKDYIPSPESGLALGYLLGQKSGVDQKIQEALRTVGLTHIIVASGAHLGVLINLARKSFGKLSRFASFLGAALLMVLFISITGLSPSMLRAGLVTIFSLTCWYFGRKIQPTRLILIVAAITLIYNPFYLIDLAWLLSFASFIGILILSPTISKFFYGKSRQPNYIFSILISSFSAALLCIPIMIYYFGQFSIISIIANLLILPTISIVMGLTFCTGIFSFFLPPIAVILGRITTFIIGYQTSVVNFFAEQSVFLVEMETGNPAIFLLYIPLVFVFIINACYSRYKLRQFCKKLA